MHRFFIDKDNISKDSVAITDSRVHQIRDVLRMKADDEIIVLDNTGFEYQVSITAISQKEITGKILHKKQSEGEPKTKITLYQSLLVRDKFELVLQKCTEIGISKFVPVITERSIIRKPEKITSQKHARFKSIITEAAEQSGRGKIPLLANPVNLDQSLSELNSYDIALVGSTHQNCLSLKNILRECRQVPANIALFIGPEGGFSQKEIEYFESSGVLAFSLGKRILRTETAGIVTPAIIFHELE